MTAEEDNPDDILDAAIGARFRYIPRITPRENEVNTPVTITIPLWVAGGILLDLEQRVCDEDSFAREREEYQDAADAVRNALREYAKTHEIPKIEDFKEEKNDDD